MDRFLSSSCAIVSPHSCVYLFRGEHDAHVNGNNYSYVSIKRNTSFPLLPSVDGALSNERERATTTREELGHFIIHTKRQIWQKELNETRSSA